MKYAEQVKVLKSVSEPLEENVETLDKNNLDRLRLFQQAINLLSNIEVIASGKVRIDDVGIKIGGEYLTGLSILGKSNIKNGDNITISITKD